MIHYKTDEEISLMTEAGVKLRRVITAIRPAIVPGAITQDIDRLAEKLVIKEGAVPAFKRVKGYHFTICVPINEQVVHTPPSLKRLTMGDVLTIDIGLYYKGFNVDFADTIIVGDVNDESKIRFLNTGKRALDNAIGKAFPGNYLGQVSQEIEQTITQKGYFIMKALTGHGIGRKLHEEPYVLGYVDGQIEKTLKIRPGLVIAIEVIYSAGTNDIVYQSKDKWSIASADSSLTACFEHTVAVTQNGPKVIT